MPPIQLRRRLPLALAALALAAAPAAAASPRSLVVGASESAGLVPDTVVAKAKMDLALLAGYRAIGLTVSWSHGLTEPTAADLAALQSAAGAAQLDGIRIYVSVLTGGSKQTPVTAQDRADYASYVAALARALPSVQDYVVGNEPNLNRFWMPQFGPHGRDAAGTAYEALLAQTYDALKAVSPQTNVIGGGLAPRGGDNPRAARQTHSPTAFLRDLGRALRASRRSAPIMDMLAIHPYGENSRVAPAARHPRTTSIAVGDYAKLTALLRTSFRGTGQPGARLPILYAEYGVQTRIPESKLAVYTNLGVATAGDAVDEATQGRFYAQAIGLAYCQPTVKGLLFFHVEDEADLDRWQSGVFYADDTPKTDLPTVKAAADAATAGTLACARPRKPKKHGPGHKRGR